MSLAAVGIIGIVILLFVLFFLGMPVGFAMAIVGFAGFAYVVSFKAALSMVAIDIWATFSKYGLTVIPLFILMGYLAFNSGIAEKLYNTAYKWFGHFRGGLAIATIGADELFAAICGSNTATAATMGAIAIPQMNKYNYDTRLSSGTVVTGGTLGTVMPPSVLLIIIGLQTEQSIIKLFLAGILPAIVLGIFFVVTISVLCRIYPNFGPAGPRTSFREKLKSLAGVTEAVAIFVLVIGGLYAGVFTPTEAGAAGVLLTLIVTAPAGRLNWKGILDSVKDTLKISCMAFVLVTGALIFGRFLAVTRLPFMVADFAASLPVSPYVILIIVLLIYLIGGCFMDALGFLVLTIPIFFPLGKALGFDPIWYSIIITMVTTLGAITPPVGVNIYVVKALAPEIDIGTIFKSASYFLLACIVSIAILVIFPQIVLVIPNMVR
ncbi:MAG: TRAP transporter large permease [Deltaproteobacteria bacterium]|nr:TRAP transporter large permease [Deltaproteobacteria bacterium]MBW1920579.1 TRAP transporter large permease [Deltaproteobacteria bacterium]MBW1934072.1 TRAP transporter large permease [Deltaproteobacteria bacterium]MBW1976356.1 TRAP transporter large permease [Deltaproteobacteria bacterium]MBW2043366.1 TRAP transporter large permease [Deltaproteobacteria bacterium]